MGLDGAVGVALGHVECGAGELCAIYRGVAQCVCVCVCLCVLRMCLCILCIMYECMYICTMCVRIYAYM